MLINIKKDIFENARIKLTLYYVLIIAVISFLFSFMSYNQVVRETNRGFKMQRARMIIEQNPGRIGENIEERLEIADEIKERVRANTLINLFILNSGIIVLAFAGSYYLSGVTLKPIKRSMEKQDNFIANASHELKTPITNIKLENEIALDSKINLTQAKKIIKSNLEEADILNNLINKLINQNLINKEHKLNKIELANVVEKTVNQMIKPSAIRNIKIHSKLTPCYILGNKDLISKLVTIYLDNAIKFSSDNSSINVELNKNKNKVTLVVSNKGKQISQKDIGKIFDRFYTVNKSRTKNGYSSHGLGLSIAKEIVEIHNGKIQVKSDSNKTQFITTFDSI